MPNLTEIAAGAGAREALTVIVSLMVAVIVVLSALLIVHKLYVEFQERRYRRLRGLYLARMEGRLADSGVPVEKPLRAHEYEVWADVIAELMETRSGEAAARLKEEARHLNLDAYFREMAAARSWTRRFAAVEKLGILKLPEMKGLYLEMLRHETTPHTVAKTVWALGMIADDGAAVAAVNEVLKNPAFMSSKYAEFIYSNIINSFRDAGRDEDFLAVLADVKGDAGVPLVLKRDIVSACGSARFFPARKLIRDFFYCFHDSPEMRIACIRALQRLADNDAAPIIAEGLEDPDWRVRAVAAGGASVCGEPVLGKLRAALRDPQYHVRINSALSLAKLGPHGIAALTETTRADDRFAGDAARYALKR